MDRWSNSSSSKNPKLVGSKHCRWNPSNSRLSRGISQPRYYLHSPEEAEEHNTRLGTKLDPGQFTPWEDIPTGTDLLFYEGLHGGVVGKDYDVASFADLLVGVVPN